MTAIVEGTFPTPARLRVSGAITMRFLSRNGPIWYGENKSTSAEPMVGALLCGTFALPHIARVGPADAPSLLSRLAAFDECYRRMKQLQIFRVISGVIVVDL